MASSINKAQNQFYKKLRSILHINKNLELIHIKCFKIQINVLLLIRVKLLHFCDKS